MTNLIALPSGTVLVGDYRIERVLGAGGFGITYLATEIALARLVTIKEYFPSDIAAREGNIEAAPRSRDCSGDYKWGLDRFIEEAQTLAKFDHTNIVRVYRYFRANNTGYMVLHFEEGKSLKGWLQSLGRAPRQKELDAILGPLLDALELIHKSDFLHRDIAPDNIIIRTAGDPVLIDFGSARGEIASHTKTVSALVKPGYSPYEQYAETSHKQGPWTDMYALAGTLYHAITGKRPPDAPSRMVKDDLIPAREGALSSYRAGFLKAIDKALMLTVEKRPQTIAAWRHDLFVPDPVRTGWLGRTGGRGKSRKQDEAVAADAAAPADQAAQPVHAQAAAEVAAPKALAPKLKAQNAPVRKPVAKEAPVKQQPVLDVAEGKTVLAATVPLPQPERAPVAAAAAPVVDEASKPKGGLLDFLEGLRKKQSDNKLADGAAVKAAPKPQPKLKPAAPLPLAEPKPAPAPVAQAALPPLGVAAAKKKPPQKAPIPKDHALVVVKAPSRPKPRRMKGSRPSLVPMLFKLLVGVGVASAAVAMQDRLPQFENRGSAVTTGITTGSTTSPPALEAQEQAQSAKAAIVTPIAEVAAHNGAITGAVFTADGRRILTSGADGTMKLWDASHRTLVRTIELDDGAATSLALNGSRALTAHANGKVVMWDIDTAAKLVTVQRNEANVWAVKFAGDPERFAVASHDGGVALWDARQPSAPLAVLDGHENAVQALAFSPQQLLLASGGADRVVRLWNLDTLSLKRAYRGARDFVTAAAFSRSGKLIAAGSLDGRIQVLSTLSQRRMRVLNGHRGRVSDVAFSVSGDELVSAGEDGTVRLWDLKRGRILRALPGHVGGATKVIFSPDGQQLVSTGTDGRLRFWQLPFAAIAQE
ncbi:serine/threonine-protein kinase [Hyphomicrobium sp. D-2]|uniref:serine/threonine-protein kinase n=1 Tax=Hyphomicrobium sp. D-2 TaxID=3041621 RepID=UPI002457B17E|nr:serine/threonine-protein kinase [Hyphomicrobium sp. D-2]MDH4983223.1 serine/threonine protein kinase [Hyphomicrobium sp. D-2]